MFSIVFSFVVIVVVFVLRAINLYRCSINCNSVGRNFRFILLINSLFNSLAGWLAACLDDDDWPILLILRLNITICSSSSCTCSDFTDYDHVMLVASLGLMIFKKAVAVLRLRVFDWRRSYIGWSGLSLMRNKR